MVLLLVPAQSKHPKYISLFVHWSIKKLYSVEEVQETVIKYCNYRINLQCLICQIPLNRILLLVWHLQTIFPYCSAELKRIHLHKLKSNNFSSCRLFDLPFLGLIERYLSSNIFSFVSIDFLEIVGKQFFSQIYKL